GIKRLREVVSDKISRTNNGLVRRNFTVRIRLAASFRDFITTPAYVTNTLPPRFSGQAMPDFSCCRRDYRLSVPGGREVAAFLCLGFEHSADNSAGLLSEGGGFQRA